MRLSTALLLFAALAACVTARRRPKTTTPRPTRTPSIQAPPDIDDMDLDALTALVDELEDEQIRHEEHIRRRVMLEGHSGIKQTRRRWPQYRPLMEGTHIGWSAAGDMHTHSDSVDVLGLGELHAVLAGYEFTTRHNDYTLLKPGAGGKFLSYEAIDTPAVPASVLSAGSIDAQIQEMRAIFNEFAISGRSDHFKALFCYLEGQWLSDYDEKITEPFPSPRHRLNASTWEELHAKAHFNAMTGSISPKENLATLPTRLFKTGRKTGIAQFLYRIMCRELPEEQVPGPEDFELVDEVAVRFAHKWTFDEYREQRNARFRLRRELQDDIMKQVPGLDGNFNYQKFNGARVPDDSEVYAARTTMHRNVLDRVSYAIPLEVVFLTPLSNWNPYNIPVVNSKNQITGKGTVENPFQQVSPNGRHYCTPTEFFDDYEEVGIQSADSALKPAFVKVDGETRSFAPSGPRILMPRVHDKILRTRYPVFPVHAEGTRAGQEINAFKELLLNPAAHKRLIPPGLLGKTTYTRF